MLIILNFFRHIIKFENKILRNRDRCEGCRIFPCSNSKKNYEIWLILQGSIVIPAECIFENKMASAPGALTEIIL